MNRVESLILEIKSELKKGKKFFGSYILNNLDVIFELLDKVEDEMPIAVQEAEEVLKEKNKIIQEARELSVKTTQQAKAEADYLLSGSSITEKAKKEAVNIIREADKNAFEIEKDLKQRIDKLLGDLENTLKNHRDLVRNDREELSGELLKQYVPCKVDME